MATDRYGNTIRSRYSSKGRRRGESARAAKVRKDRDTAAAALGYASYAEKLSVAGKPSYQRLVGASIDQLELFKPSELSVAERRIVLNMWRLRHGGKPWQHKPPRPVTEWQRAALHDWLQMLGYDVEPNTGKADYDY